MPGANGTVPLLAVQRKGNGCPDPPGSYRPAAVDLSLETAFGRVTSVADPRVCNPPLSVHQKPIGSTCWNGSRLSPPTTVDPSAERAVAMTVLVGLEVKIPSPSILANSARYPSASTDGRRRSAPRRLCAACVRE